LALSGPATPPVAKLPPRPRSALRGGVGAGTVRVAPQHGQAVPKTINYANGADSPCGALLVGSRAFGGAAASRVVQRAIRAARTARKTAFRTQPSVLMPASAAERRGQTRLRPGAGSTRQPNHLTCDRGPTGRAQGDRPSAGDWVQSVRSAGFEEGEGVLQRGSPADLAAGADDMPAAGRGVAKALSHGATTSSTVPRGRT